jgi:hypothetical protein
MRPGFRDLVRSPTLRKRHEIASAVLTEAGYRVTDRDGGAGLVGVPAATFLATYAGDAARGELPDEAVLHLTSLLARRPGPSGPRSNVRLPGTTAGELAMPRADQLKIQRTTA